MQPTAPDPEQLRASLARLLGRIDSIRPIESGTSGQSYRVETGAGVFAAKQFFDDAKFLLGPMAQHRLLETLAPLDMTARPVAADDTDRLLVTEWVHDGRPAVPSELAEPERIGALVRVIKALHSVRHDVPEFRPHDYISRYVDAVGGYDQLGRQDRARYDEFSELVSELDRNLADPCVCHNDLAAENWLVGANIRLIDFDFAVTAPPIIDLASLAEMNQFDAAANRALLAAYFDDGESSPGELVAARRLLCLLAHFWALASADAGAAIVAQYRIDND